MDALWTFHSTANLVKWYRWTPNVVQQTESVMLSFVMRLHDPSLLCAQSALLNKKVFSSIVRDFLELFYNLWRTVLVKNKIVLDPALRLQSFRTPKTQQLVSEVGLNANNKSDGGPVPDSSRKIDRQHECQYGRNEIGLDRQHECQHGRNEIGVDRHECQYGRNEIRT
ncbi:hypothetical protein TNCV_4152241 [Trichonephila clavipes]|nr:hypothetical protein TNCV_4152241 [Trichonephila clavipes]